MYVGSEPESVDSQLKSVPPTDSKSESVAPLDSRVESASLGDS